MAAASVCGVFGQAPAADAPAKVISSIPFVLSKEAEAVGIDGTLSVDITVDKSGAVKKADIVAGPAWPCGTELKKELEDVRRAVKENVMAAKFSPTIKGGKAESTDLQLKFKIGEAYQNELRKREREEALRNGTAPPVFVKAGVVNGKALSLPKPGYPSAARPNRIGGTVSVEVHIDEKGNVVRAGAISGHPVLQDASRVAACGAKFSPTKLDGNFVRVSGVVTYNFVP
ncbi:MAG: energy transducer TonB [Pyrinomonadaceae bacterium]|nr:TonB family protein [Chloracidobacterium sp.]